uniref:Galanin peptides n=1 Tax=Labrus bergylta TaxID=56723 RepID=A0A3Q3FD76_9LABR
FKVVFFVFCLSLVKQIKLLTAMTNGIDGHRTLGDKPGLAGKRDMGQEEDFRTGAMRIADGDIIHTVVDFLSYLKLKEMGALDTLPSSVTSEELANP